MKVLLILAAMIVGVILTAVTIYYEVLGLVWLKTVWTNL